MTVLIFKNIWDWTDVAYLQTINLVCKWAASVSSPIKLKLSHFLELNFFVTVLDKLDNKF
jgi:hypothetical protein